MQNPAPPHYLSNEIKLLKLFNLSIKTAKQVIKYQYFLSRNFNSITVFSENAKTSNENAKSKNYKNEKTIYYAVRPFKLISPLIC